MFDLLSPSGRARALRRVQPDWSEMSHALTTHGAAMAKALTRGHRPVWLSLGGAALAAGALLWLIRPSSEGEPATRRAAPRKRRAPARPAATQRASSRAKAKANG
ncbi:MAG: hypothetical protein IT548_16860 [Alphaproteobacteria bacterium]|nr:hypothetical protein [Alphaproteobacteria bacterium]